MSNHPKICFACGKGSYQEVLVDYLLDLPDGDTLTVPKLLVLRCDKCGEQTIPPDSSRQIETAVDQHQDTLPPAAVRSLLEQFQIDQTEAAEALGMGGKTFHRWAHGTQRISRSMGYFLRALKAHPDVFEWIRDRRWRQADQKTSETQLREEPAAYKLSKPDKLAIAPASPPPSAASPIAPSAKLLETVVEILSLELAKPATETEVAEMLGVSKPQAKEWLNRLVRRGVLKKSSRPVRFQTVKASDTLL
jgi:putative zinc finger/helix-turn-helix YgiT family protein